MLDWKKKVEKKRSEELIREDEERARRKVQEEKRESKGRIEEEKLKAERARRLAKLQSRFKCHICGKPSLTPGERQESTDRLVQHHEFYSGPKEYEKITIEDWNTPGDLIRCDKCKKWSCSSHIHWGICKNCAERL